MMLTNNEHRDTVDTELDEVCCMVENHKPYILHHTLARFMMYEQECSKKCVKNKTTVFYKSGYQCFVSFDLEFDTCT